MPSGSWVELARALQNEFPHAAHVRLGRPQMSDRDADREAAAKARVRDEDVAAAVDAVDDALVGRIEFGVRECALPRLPPETDYAQRRRREPLEVRVGVDPRGELACKADVLGEPRADRLRAEGEPRADRLRAVRAQDHPQFQRSKT